MESYSIDNFISPAAYKLCSKHWQKFFNKFLETPHIPVSNWKEHHLLGYILHRCSIAYETPLSLSFSSAPSKCEEIVFVKRMIVMLGGVGMEIMKKYVDWVFDKKIIPNRMKIRKLTLFLNTSLANEFINEYSKNIDGGNVNKALQSNILTRGSELPNHILEIIKSQNMELKTYGDLAFAKMAADQENEEYMKLFESLKLINFDTNILADLK
jgi:hypothetical protein